MRKLKSLAAFLASMLLCVALVPAAAWADSSESIYKAAFTADEQIGSNQSIDASISEDATAIVVGVDSFGFSSFERMNKGTNRA